MPLSNITTRFMDYLPRLLEALPVAGMIMVGAWILNLLIARAMSLVARRTRLTDMDVLPICKILGWGVRLIALILILSVFGFQIGGIWAMLSTIFGLVAIGFVAVWSILSHTSATMLILFLHPFQVGDDVEFPGEPVKGRVIDLNFFLPPSSTTTECSARSRIICFSKKPSSAGKMSMWSVLRPNSIPPSRPPWSCRPRPRINPLARSRSLIRTCSTPIPEVWAFPANLVVE